MYALKIRCEQSQRGIKLSWKGRSQCCSFQVVNPGPLLPRQLLYHKYYQVIVFISSLPDLECPHRRAPDRPGSQRV